MSDKVPTLSWLAACGVSVCTCVFVRACVHVSVYVWGKTKQRHERKQHSCVSASSLSLSLVSQRVLARGSPCVASVHLALHALAVTLHHEPLSFLGGAKGCARECVFARRKRGACQFEHAKPRFLFVVSCQELIDERKLTFSQGPGEHEKTQHRTTHCVDCSLSCFLLPASSTFRSAHLHHSKLGAGLRCFSAVLSSHMPCRRT